MAQDSIHVESVDCPNCGTPEKKLLCRNLSDVEDGVPGQYEISRCLQCGLKYLSIRPSVSSIGRCYPADYHVRGTNEVSFLSRVIYFPRLFFRRRRLEKGLGFTPASLLEMGCGNAKFLSYLEKCWGSRCKLSGVDLSLKGISLPSDSKIVLLESKIEDLHPDQQFEVIVMHEVLEHLSSPKETLTQLKKFLTPKGFLIGQVPNWNSLWRKAFPYHWSGLQIPRHLTFFDRETLRITLQKSGFDLQHVGAAWDPGDLSVSLCNWITDKLGLETRSRQAWFFMPMALFSAPITFLLALFGFSGEMEFVARRLE